MVFSGVFTVRFWSFVRLRVICFRVFLRGVVCRCWFRIEISVGFFFRLELK